MSSSYTPSRRTRRGLAKVRSGQKSRSGLKDARRAEKRREAEAAAPAQGFEISSPYGVNHSLFLEEHVTPRDQAGAQRKTI